MAQIKIKDLSEILKGMENIPEDQRSSRLEETKAMLAQSIAPQLIKQPDKTSDASIDKLNKTENKVLDEVRKTNSLLSGFIQSISKVFESNNELIERMLISQEQEKERGRRSIDVPVKKDGEARAEGRRGVDIGEIGALAGLAAILAGTIDKIIPALKEFYDTTLKPYLDPILSFAKTAGEYFANNKEVSSTLIKILNAMGVNTPEYTRGGKKIGFLGTEEDIAEQKRRNAQQKAIQAKAAEAKAAFAGEGPEADDEAQKRRLSSYQDAKQRESDALETKRKLNAKNAAGSRAGAQTGATSVPQVAAKASRKEKLKGLVSKAVERSVGGVVGLVSKQVPILGAFVAGGSAVGRLGRGDYMGAFIDAAQAAISIAEATPAGVGMAPQLAAMSSALGTGQLVNDIRRDAEGIEELKNVSADEITEAVNEYLSEVWNKISSYQGRGPTEEELNQTVERNVGISFPEGRQQRRLNPETGELEVITPAANGPSNVTPSQSGMARARQLELQASENVTPVTRTAPRIDRDHSGGTVINDNRVINNVDNSRAGGGGSAPGFPNSSTAPSNPWDAPLYGAGMNYF